MSASPRIQLLPEHLIDQIKAGEVIERPANVLKELMENALDAGATRIDVEIQENGLALLRVSDDGRGIPADQIELAFGRHATSKIQRFEDLYRLNSFGFRGEALPSIASISRMECVSWTREERQGGTLRFEGGLAQGVHSAQKAGQEHGTIMSVRDLFFNTPVRLKFLQSTGAERSWLKRFFYAFVLAYPEISFTLQWDQDERLLYPATGPQGHDARVRQLFGQKAREQIVIHPSTREWQGLQCRVLLIETKNFRTEGPLEHVLINRRPVLDKSWPRVAQQVLEKYWPGELPCVLISMNLPGDQVDVNVHPNKTVVKFHQQGEVLALLTATLREALPQVKAATPELPTEVRLSFEAPKQQDLPRDREDIYAHHRGIFTDSLRAETSFGPSPVQVSWPGPYYLEAQGERTYYVDGKALLTLWAGERLKGSAESTPLLVSYPLRDLPLKVEQVAQLRQAGFELDELEPNLWVLRAIPVWAQGIPLASVVSAALLASGVRSLELSDFTFEAFSQGKWRELWDALTLESILKARAAVELGPALFGRRS